MKNVVILSLVLTSSIATGAGLFSADKTSFNGVNRAEVVRTDSTQLEGNAYDTWCLGWSKANHVYFHYNRGTKGGYDERCLWIWNNKKHEDGTLWAYSGNTQVSDDLSLVPMSTSWMTGVDVEEDGSEIRIDKYGVIADVDLTKTLYEGKVKTGSALEKCNYDNCTDLGYLFPEMATMDGATHWTSDGNADNDIPDWSYSTNPENWIQTTDGGYALHIFVSSGALDQYSFHAGDGTPQVVINPLENVTDEIGPQYSSKQQQIADTYGLSSTSDSFKDLGVGYQIFVASFRDSNMDGYGDIRGVINSLDYLEDLGVDVLWLTPIQKAESYHGYDIVDYYQINSKFGTLADYRELIFKAHQKGMKVIMDLVLNHTSLKNTWFKKSQWGVNSGLEGTKNDNTGINWRDIYTWKYKTDKVEVLNSVYHADPRDDEINKYGEYTFTGYENISVEAAHNKDGTAWFKDGESDYYYYGKFASTMPELNYDNAQTRKLVTDMAKYWLSFGLDGYRLDAVKHIFMKDECQNSNGDQIITDLSTKHVEDEEKGGNVAEPCDYSTNLTKNVAFWKEFANELKAVYPNCFLVGENFDGYGAQIAPYYNGLDSQFDFSNYYHIPSNFYNNADGALSYQNIQAAETFDNYSGSGTNTLTYGGNKPTVTLNKGNRPDFINGSFTSNHDVMRAINQANGYFDANKGEVVPKQVVSGTTEEIGRAKVHAAATILSPGISWIYYGDELGMSSNTDQHYALYETNNSVDIWYRQPMLWGDRLARPNFVEGFNFSTEYYDSYNSKLNSSLSKQEIYFDENGNTVTDNTMYKFYKELCALKKRYPKGATVTYEYSGTNVLGLNVKDAQGKSVMRIFINIGVNDDAYELNPGSTYNSTPIAKIGCESMDATPGKNFSYWYAVVAYEAK